MAVSAKVYNRAIASLSSGLIDWEGDDIRVMLLTSAYTPSQTTHQYLSALVANEVTGTGYTAGGVALTSKTEAITGQVLALDAANVTWSNSTITARYAIVYDRTPASDATRPLVAYVDFGENIASSGGDFTITWDAAGIVTFTVA